MLDRIGPSKPCNRARNPSRAGITHSPEAKSPLLAVLLLCTLVQARGQCGGGEPGRFLSLAAGARALGMGKASEILAENASAVQGNPAAMTQLRAAEIQATHSNLFQQANVSALSYVQPTARAGTLGAGCMRLAADGFERVSAEFDPSSGDVVDLERLGEFSDVRQAWGFSYARPVLRRIALGVSTHWMVQRMDSFRQSCFSADLGGFSAGRHSLSVVVQNLVSKASDGTDDRMPLTVRVGNSLRLCGNRLLLAAEVSHSAFSGVEYSVGTEYWVAGFAGLRLGLAPGGVPAVGFGLKRRNLALDLAAAPHELGWMQRFSATWRFDRDVRTR